MRLINFRQISTFFHSMSTHLDYFFMPRGKDIVFIVHSYSYFLCSCFWRNYLHILVSYLAFHIMIIICIEWYGFKYCYLIQIIYTQFYDFKYSYLILIIYTQLYGFKYSYLILIIYTQFYDFKYSYLIQIIYTQFFGFKYSYLILMIIGFQNLFLFDNQTFFYIELYGFKLLMIIIGGVLVV